VLNGNLDRLIRRICFTYPSYNTPGSTVESEQICRSFGNPWAIQPTIDSVQVPNVAIKLGSTCVGLDIFDIRKPIATLPYGACSPTFVRYKSCDGVHRHVAGTVIEENDVFSGCPVVTGHLAVPFEVCSKRSGFEAFECLEGYCWSAGLE